MSEIFIKKIEYPKDLKTIKDAINIRREVFGKEQEISEREDLDGQDNKAIHVIGYLNGRAISCARVRFINGKAKLERIATLKECRKKGYGSQMINFLTEYCKGKGIKEVYFDAQLHAEEFYERFGFKQRGNVFEEVGVPHVEMYMGVLN